MALRGALTHRKTRKLARLLGIPPCFALGILEAMWHATAALFPTGSLGRMTNEEIADQIGYTADPDQLVAGLVEAGLLDEHRLHRLIVHDWHQHSDNTLDAALYRRGERYANGSIPRGIKLGKEEKAALTARFYRRPADSLFDTPETQQDVTVPSATAVAEEIPGAHVLPIDGWRKQSGSAPNGAAKRLPEPEPEPEPEPGPTSPTPPQTRRGAWRELAQRVAAAQTTHAGRALDLGAAHVLERCSVSGIRAVKLHTVAWAAIEAECRRVDKPPEDHALQVADTMAANYEEYIRLGDLVQMRFGLARFLEEGHWRNWQGWRINHAEAGRRTGANTGRYLN